MSVLIKKDLSELTLLVHDSMRNLKRAEVFTQSSVCTLGCFVVYAPMNDGQTASSTIKFKTAKIQA